MVSAFGTMAALEPLITLLESRFAPPIKRGIVGTFLFFYDR